MKLAVIALITMLTGCSFALQPHRSRNPYARQPSSVPFVIDGAVAMAALATGISESSVSCSSSQSLCLSNIDHAVGAVALGIALVSAASAVYGYSRNAETPEASSALANHVAIAAHAGNCAAASTAATQLRAADPATYDRILGDDVIVACLFRDADAPHRD